MLKLKTIEDTLFEVLPKFIIITNCSAIAQVQDVILFERLLSPFP